MLTSGWISSGPLSVMMSPLRNPLRGDLRWDGGSLGLIFSEIISGITGVVFLESTSSFAKSFLLCKLLYLRIRLI